MCPPFGPLHFDRRRVSSFDELVDQYGAWEFHSPCRSTIPLLALVRDGASQFQQLLHACGLPDTADLHFEWREQPRRGRGRPSHTDVMVKSGEQSLAIEAKWTEPRYDTVTTWLGKSKDARNRSDVLRGWLDLIEGHAVGPLLAEDFHDAVYQMIHRAASACAVGYPRLAYLQFSLPGSAQRARAGTVQRDLVALRSLLGSGEKFPFYYVHIEIEPTANYGAIHGLQKRTSATAERVREALRGGPLFEFRALQIHPISSPDESPTKV